MSKYKGAQCYKDQTGNPLLANLLACSSFNQGSWVQFPDRSQGIGNLVGGGMPHYW